MARKMSGKSLQQKVTLITIDIFVFIISSTWLPKSLKVFCLENHRISLKVWICL